MQVENTSARSCRYRIVSEVCGSCDVVEYLSYGIQAISGNKEDEQIYCTISDISTDKSQVSEMVRKFNRFHLSSIHFLDAVQDMLP